MQSTQCRKLCIRLAVLAKKVLPWTQDILFYRGSSILITKLYHLHKSTAGHLPEVNHAKTNKPLLTMFTTMLPIIISYNFPLFGRVSYRVYVNFNQFEVLDYICRRNEGNMLLMFSLPQWGKIYLFRRCTYDYTRNRWLHRCQSCQ